MRCGCGAPDGEHRVSYVDADGRQQLVARRRPHPRVIAAIDENHPRVIAAIDENHPRHHRAPSLKYVGWDTSAGGRG
jgi:hypothetical protein